MDNDNLLNTSHSADLSPRKQVIAQHFSRASEYNQHAHIQQQTCQQLCNKIAKKNQISVLEIGAGRGQLTRLIADNISSNHWLINELCDSQADSLQSILPSAHILIGDAETLPLISDINKRHSLIISANAVQWFDQPLGFIEQSYQRLAPEGQLLFNTFSPDNFLEIKTLTGQGLSYPSNSEWQSVLEASNFENISLETHDYQLHFTSPYEVLKHMKLTGVSTNQTQIDSSTVSSSSSTKTIPFIWTKSKLKTFESAYWDKFSSVDQSGQHYVTLTYSVLIINAFKSF